MKHIRMFENAQQAADVLSTLEYNTLSAIRGENGISLKPGVLPPTPSYPTPFYIEDVSGSDNTIYVQKSGDSAPTLTIEKSLDGTTWETMGETTTEGISAIIPANSKLYLRCDTDSWCTSGYYKYRNYFNITGNCNVGGNIMSLLYGSNFTGSETTFPSESDNIFYGLFYRSSVPSNQIIDASELILPATTLTQSCYAGMFNNCTKLTTAPALPATTMVYGCYSSMFKECRALTTAPQLPATTVADSCYTQMFESCISLTTAPAILPATTLFFNCYNGMFQSCLSLTTAPELPATTLAEACYQQMFAQCSKLNYIKCLATNKSASNCTQNWVNGVASAGTFIKNPDGGNWPSGKNGIPSGWTVEDAA